MQQATLPLLLSMLVVLVVPHSRNLLQTNNRRGAPQDEGTVIFSIIKYGGEPAYIEPIVIIRGQKYTAPPVDGPEALTKKFTDTFFHPGRTYRVVFGGGDAGTLTVVKAVEPGCVGLTAEVQLQTSARIGGQVEALAVSSEIGRGASFRRAPTEDERAAALAVARRIYTQRRVSAALIKKMSTVNLTAIDVERDGKVELIGSFQIRGANYVSYDLFVIFEPAAAGNYKPALTWYNKGGEENYESRSLVDVVDLDGDHIAEVIAGSSYYESNDYVIYKRQAATWRPIYNGGGGGC